ncbi:hypothetical protein [Pseudobacteriovorax antillogorgiicola]|nr:hypothetical protein [Pseudobacteriovorax antillogorgiicola]
MDTKLICERGMEQQKVNGSTADSLLCQNAFSIRLDCFLAPLVRLQ